jgi:hypothetical protein
MIHRRFGVQFGLEQRNLFVVSMWLVKTSASLSTVIC